MFGRRPARQAKRFRFPPASEPTARELAFWDAANWAPRTMVRHLLRWINADRRRRGVFWCLIVMQVLGLIAGVGAVGTARARTGAASVEANGSMSNLDALEWTNIKDSSGVPLSEYLFATNHGSILHPGNTALWVIIGLEFTVFMVVVIAAIWLIDYALSFQWLQWFDTALTSVAGSLTRQIATPIVLLVATTIGAFFVAWFVMRGHPAKAVMQIIAMLAVALMSVTYLARPVADVLSPDGLLAQGRDVGIAIAAGLNGNANPSARSIVGALNGTLADNFARHPVQVWNFGHVLDSSRGCRQAWSTGIISGSESRVASELQRCGDSYAHAKIENPSMSQIGTGLVLLIFATILLLFGAYLAIKIFLAALSSVYHAILAIFGFAAGGYIYGPTQTFLVHNLVDIVGDAAAMVAFTVYLGAYALVLDDVFRAAPQGGIAVIFVGGLMMVAGIVLLKRLDTSLLRGNSRLADQIRAALAGQPAPAAAGAGEMGSDSLRHTLSPGHLATVGMKRLNDINSINANPVTTMLFRRPNPLTYWSKKQQHMNDVNYEFLFGRIPPEARGGWMGRLTSGKNAHDHAATVAVQTYGGHTPRAAAAAVANVLELGGDGGDAMGALLAAGFPHDMARHAIRAQAHMVSGAEENPVTYKPLANAAAALDLAASSYRRPNYSQVRRDGYRAQFAAAANDLYRVAPRPVFEDLRNVDAAFVEKVERNWNKSYDDFQTAVPHEEWGRVSDDTRRSIGHDLAEKLRKASIELLDSPSEANFAKAMEISRRAVMLDIVTSQANVGPFTN